MILFRRFQKSRYLRLVNWLGLSVIFACLLLSYSYLKKELSYDRFHTHAHRMVRLSLQWEDEPVDGRVYGSAVHTALAQLPEIKEVVNLSKVSPAVLTSDGKPHLIQDLYFADSTFFDVFTFPLKEGVKENVLRSPESIAISEKLARELTVTGSPLGKEIRLSSRKIPEKTYYIQGIFKDFPENSHFHTDIIVHRNKEFVDWLYVYLLLKEPGNIPFLEQKMTQAVIQHLEGRPKVKIHLTPITDIRLHSRVLREMEPNGNIYYIYLIIGANILLLTVVLFNLWLNSRLIFSSNRNYYRLLRLNGASSLTVLKEEGLLNLLYGILSIAGGILTALLISCNSGISTGIPAVPEITLLSLAFLTVVLFISLLPVITRLSSTLFMNEKNESQPIRFSFSGIKHLLTAQYCIVIFVIAFALGINNQLRLIRKTQVGGPGNTILALPEQPEEVKKRYPLLKNELLKHPEIESVTAAMQLPGSAIRDMISVKVEGNPESKQLPLLVVGEDFFSFFRIQPVAGTVFSPLNYTPEKENEIFLRSLENQKSDIIEEYMLNRKALNILGFDSPQEAIGKQITLTNSINYIHQGIICGITDDFNYTTIYEEQIPTIILQRHLFLHCLMIRLNPDRPETALRIFNETWQQINPDYPANYHFLEEEYGKIYHNELNADRLVKLFSLLCLIVADLGLIIFMAFLIKRQTKEIAIRKINGATSGEIIRMLNMHFIGRIGLAFIIATPPAWYCLHSWLKNFAYKAPIHLELFLLAGFIVLILSIISVSGLSWKAGSFNPADVIKSE